MVLAGATAAPSTLKSDYRLDRITVRTTGQLGLSKMLKQCNFSYEQVPDSKLMFLKELDVSGEGKYHFEYDQFDSFFPKHGTTGLDAWGFYNNEQRYNLNVENMNSSISTIGTMKGMLRKIVYPLKGYTCFDYEQNNCSRMLVRHEDEPLFPFLRDCSIQEIGGLRIKKISDYSYDGRLTFFREFDYSFDELKNNTIIPRSSGISMKSLVYLEGKTPQKRDFGTEPPLNDFLTGGNSNYYLNETGVVEYSQVKEKFPDGSYTIYYFSDYLLLPDIIEETETVLIFRTASPLPLQRKAFSRAPQRGKLIKKEEYTNDHRLVSSERFVYDYSQPLKSREIIESTSHYHYVYRHYLSDYPLRKHITSLYSGSDSLVTTVLYDYNKEGQLVKTSTTNSSGETIEKSTQYVTDIPNPAENILNSHMISLPLRTKETVKFPEGDSRLIGATRYEYVANGVPRLHKTHVANLVNIPSGLADFSFDAYLEEDMEYNYNSKGNLVWALDKEQVRTVFLWGYNGLYPVAKIENADLDELIRLFGSAQVFETPFVEGLSMMDIGKLYNLKNCSVTVYDYYPFVGVRSIKSPDGKTVYYEYDNAGRLISVADHKGRLMNSYDYHVRE
jgi:YD repeat-containing protein